MYRVVLYVLRALGKSMPHSSAGEDKGRNGLPIGKPIWNLKFQSDTRGILQGSVDLGSGTETPVELRKERGAPKPELADVSDYSCKSSNLSIFR